MSRSGSASHSGHPASCHGPQRNRTPSLGRAGLARRAAIFLTLAAAVVVAAAMLWPRGAGVAEADTTVTITMGGFSPKVITAPASRPLRVQIVNPDSQFHSDGGGWHQLAIPALGVDARVAPRSESIVEIPAAAPGDYPFYCDVCCGGKENPSMQGVLRVVA